MPEPINEDLVMSRQNSRLERNELQEKWLQALEDGDLQVFEELLNNKQLDPRYKYERKGTCLEIACRLQDRGVFIRALLKKVSPSVNKIIPEPIHYAARCGADDAMAELLLHRNTNVNATTATGETPLHFLAKYFVPDAKYRTCLSLLLNRDDIEINRANNKGFTIIHQAAHNKKREMVEKILQDFRDDLDLDSYSGSGRSAREILKQEYPDLVPMFPSNRNKLSVAYGNQLLNAFNERHLEIFGGLLRQVDEDGNAVFDANFRYGKPYNETCLEMACRQEGYGIFVNILLNSGADPNLVNPKTNMAPIQVAAEALNYDVLDILLKNPSTNPNTVDTRGWTALHYAANSSVLESLYNLETLPSPTEEHYDEDKNRQTLADFERCINLLYKCISIPVNMEEVIRTTNLRVYPLAEAFMKGLSDKGSQNVLNELTEYIRNNQSDEFIGKFQDLWENDENVLNDQKHIFLQLATEKCLPKVVAELIAKETDPNKFPTNGVPPLIIAVEKDNIDILRHLLTAPEVDVDITDGTGCTALHHAIRTENYDIIVALLNHGANITHENVLGKTPFTVNSLETLLDKSLKTKLFPRSPNYEVIFDYTLLTASKTEYEQTKPSITRNVSRVAQDQVEVDMNTTGGSGDAQDQDEMETNPIGCCGVFRNQDKKKTNTIGCCGVARNEDEMEMNPTGDSGDAQDQDQDEMETNPTGDSGVTRNQDEMETNPIGCCGVYRNQDKKETNTIGCCGFARNQVEMETNPTGDSGVARNQDKKETNTIGCCVFARNQDEMETNPTGDSGDVQDQDVNTTNMHEHTRLIKTPIHRTPVGLKAETNILHFISKHPNDYKRVLEHPIISSFLEFKWKCVRHFFYTNLIFYFLFFIILNGYIMCNPSPYLNTTSVNLSKCFFVVDSPNLNFSADVISRMECYEVKNDGHFAEESLNCSEVIKSCVLPGSELLENPVSNCLQQDGCRPWLIFLIILTACLAFREFFQLFISGLTCSYWKNIENYLDLLIVAITIAVMKLPDDNPHIDTLRVYAILFSSCELVLLLGRMPLLSRNIEMLKTVTISYVKIFLTFLAIILAFAHCLHIIFRQDMQKQDVYPALWTICRTFVFMTGEYEAQNLNFSAMPITSIVVFLLFVFFISIVLLNLLIGLSVNNTKKIEETSKIVCITSRINLIHDIEFILLRFNKYCMRFNKCCTRFSICGMTLNVCCKYFSKLTESVILFPKANQKNEVIALQNKDGKLVNNPIDNSELRKCINSLISNCYAIICCCCGIFWCCNNKLCKMCRGTRIPKMKKCILDDAVKIISSNSQGKMLREDDMSEAKN